MTPKFLQPPPRKSRSIAELRKAITEAEARGDVDRAGRYFAELLKIQRRRNDEIERTEAKRR